MYVLRYPIEVDRFKFFIEIKLEVSRIHSYYIEKEIRGFFSSKTERINKEQQLNDIRRFVCCPLLPKEEEYNFLLSRYYYILK